MISKNKFYIKKVNGKDHFKKVSLYIMKSKWRIVKKTIKKYLDEDSVENLHSMRIAVRRMRYSFELFYVCFEPTYFENVYKYLQFIQDIVGELRDLDVLEEKLRNISLNEGAIIPSFLYENIFFEKDKIRQTIKTELIKFTADKQINRFSKNKTR